MRIVAEVARTWFSAVGAGHELRAQQAALAYQQAVLAALGDSERALGD